VNVAEIQEAVTDELKKVQKEEFSAAFQKMYDHAKVSMYANELILNKKGICLPQVSSVKKIVLNVWTALYIYVYNLFSSSYNIIRVLRSRQMTWDGHVALTGDRIGTYRN